MAWTTNALEWMVPSFVDQYRLEYVAAHLEERLDKVGMVEKVTPAKVNEVVIRV